MDRAEFYKNVVNKFITAKTDTVLICGGGNNDKYVFENLDFKNVTISNLDSRTEAKNFLPFKWSFQNAECPTYEELFPWLEYDKKNKKIIFNIVWSEKTYKKNE